MKSVAGPLLLVALGLSPALAQDHSHGGEEGEANPATTIYVPPKIPVSEHLTVGFQLSTAAMQGGHAHPHITSYDFVGETKDSWLVEYSDPDLGEKASLNPHLRGCKLALAVRKADGRVLHAFVAWPIGHDREHWRLLVPPLPPELEVPDPSDRIELTVKAGTFQADEFSQNGQLWWAGTEGLTREVMLRTVAVGMEYELAEIGEPEEYEIQNKTVMARKFSYTDQSALWISEDPLLTTFLPIGADRGIAKVSGPGFEMRVTRMGEDAKTTLTWPDDMSDD